MEIKRKEIAVGIRPIRPEAERLFGEIRRRISRLQSGGSLDSMEKVGADTRGQIGASYVSLRTLARGYAPDEEVACLLCGTERREEQIVACFLWPVEGLTEERMRQLLGQGHSLEIAEYAGTLLVARSGEVERWVGDFLQAEGEGAEALQVAALTAISRNRMERKGDSPFTEEYVRGLEGRCWASSYVVMIYNRLRLLV